MNTTKKQPGAPAVGEQHDRKHDDDHDLEAGRTDMEEGDHHSTTLTVSEDSDNDSSSPSSSPSSSRRHSATSTGGPAQRTASPPAPMVRISTNVSLGPDNPVEHYTSYIEVPDSVYDRLPQHRKLVIVALLSFCSFLAPISSTTVLSAVPEVAATFHTTGSIINLSNAMYMLFMGLSPIVWGPFSEVWGRKIVSWAVLFSPSADHDCLGWVVVVLAVAGAAWRLSIAALTFVWVGRPDHLHDGSALLWLQHRNCTGPQSGCVLRFPHLDSL